MNDRTDSDGFPRRQFVSLSGTVGAAALLTGLGAGRSWAANRPAHAGPWPDPTSCPQPPTGANPCPPASLQALCGSPADRDPLWYDVQYCVHGTVPPPPQPKPDCLVTTPNHVVFHGKPENTHNYLLSPSCRITGIECPFLVSSSAANYWEEAWNTARPAGSRPVIYPNIGLGINSQLARRFNQMHIHMAGVRESTQNRLQELESMSRIATEPRDWPRYQESITGTGGQDRTYRVLRLASLGPNLFELLDRYVVRPSGLEMAQQTLIVVPKKTTAGYVGTFYVLNSDTSLHDGTDTCDHLLVYQP